MHWLMALDYQENNNFHINNQPSSSRGINKFKRCHVFSKSENQSWSRGAIFLQNLLKHEIFRASEFNINFICFFSLFCTDNICLYLFFFFPSLCNITYLVYELKEWLLSKQSSDTYPYSYVSSTFVTWIR